jgi:hypothetical protein
MLGGARHSGNDPADDPGEQAIWVASDVVSNLSTCTDDCADDCTGGRTGDSTFVLAIHFADDLTHTLDMDTAWNYALTVCTASAVAAYEAAQFAQLTTKLRLPLQHAAEMMTGMRARRGRTSWSAGPMTLTPGISAFTGEPFLACEAGGQRWQWSPEDANQHAHHVIEAVPVVGLDAAYHAYLTDTLDLEPERAHNVVADIFNHRFPVDPPAAER